VVATMHSFAQRSTINVSTDSMPQSMDTRAHGTTRCNQCSESFGQRAIKQMEPSTEKCDGATTIGINRLLTAHVKSQSALHNFRSDIHIRQWDLAEDNELSSLNSGIQPFHSMTRHFRVHFKCDFPDCHSVANTW